jgi:hypothetical protein
MLLWVQFHTGQAEKLFDRGGIRTIDILYTLDSASNYPAIQKLKPWLQTQDIPMKWEDSYVFYFLNIKLNLFQIHFQTIQMMKVIVVF